MCKYFLHRYLYLLTTIAALLIPSTYAEQRSAGAEPQLPFEILARYPHSSNLFTQGLELFHGELYESSGLYGQSKLVARPFPPPPPPPSPTLRGVTLDKQLFAEGLSFHHGRLYVLTWRAGQLLEIDPERFTLLRRHPFEGQGWGLCYHRQRKMFAMSDGSDQLQWRLASDFSLVERQALRGSGDYQRLNELECHSDYVLANRWKTNEIVVIQASSGQVLGTLDLSVLQPPGLHEEAVLNGIAYDARDDSWLVTGKLWPHIYRIRITLPATLATGTTTSAQ
ncbi:glutaminyl-peptide cyclotransferase [Spongiibacter sp.]|uniref:glutaminyl-peptide cyclotransferase n=1 Tax=Spongiibacter sp. TaxID=2024860 RepID=UPI003561910D